MKFKTIIAVFICCIFWGKLSAQPGPIDLVLHVYKVVLKVDDKIISTDKFNVLLLDDYINFEANQIDFLQKSKVFSNDTVHFVPHNVNQWIVIFDNEIRLYNVPFSLTEPTFEKEIPSKNLHNYLETKRINLSNSSINYLDYSLFEPTIEIIWEDLKLFKNLDEVLVYEFLQKEKEIAPLRKTNTKTKQLDSIFYVEILDFNRQKVENISVELLHNENRIPLKKFENFRQYKTFLIPKHYRKYVTGNEPLIISSKGFKTDTLSANRYRLGNYLFKENEATIKVFGEIPFVHLKNQFVIYYHRKDTSQLNFLLNKYNLKQVEKLDECNFKDNYLYTKILVKSATKLNANKQRQIFSTLDIGMAFYDTRFDVVPQIKALGKSFYVISIYDLEQDKVIKNKIEALGFEVETENPSSYRGKTYNNIQVKIPDDMTMLQLKNLINNHLILIEGVEDIHLMLMERTCFG